MMESIGAQIIAAAHQLGVSLQTIDVGESLKHRQDIERLFAHKGTGPLWQRLKDSIGRHEPDGWRAIGRYIGERSAFLFFDADDETSFFKVHSGNDLTAVLGELPALEFYVSNEAKGYLLCHNDHDYLIGCGSATNWLKLT